MSIIRLLITAEGQTEQKFVKEVLAEHLAQLSIYANTRCVLTSKDRKAHREYRGGLLNYDKAKNDIITWIKEDNNPECYYTTMFDLYALPNDFPGFTDAANKRDPYKRVAALESGFYADINNPKFIPYIQLHEFEALILSNPQQLEWEYLEHDKPIENLISMVRDKNPELINDGATTAPSKRILKEIPEYDKVTAGVSVVGKIGINQLRQTCRHFNEWLTKLEQLGQETRSM